MENNPKSWVILLVAVWPPSCGSNQRALMFGQATNIVIKKDGRLYDVSGTAEAQSKCSAAAACLQVAAMFL